MTRMHVEEPDTCPHLAEIGWGEADPNHRDGPLERATVSVLMVAVMVGHWAAVWLVGGLAPLAFLADHARMGRRLLSK